MRFPWFIVYASAHIHFNASVQGKMCSRASLEPKFVHLMLCSARRDHQSYDTRNIYNSFNDFIIILVTCNPTVRKTVNFSEFLSSVENQM